jgi:hypothetical protein
MDQASRPAEKERAGSRTDDDIIIDVIRFVSTSQSSVLEHTLAVSRAGTSLYVRTALTNSPSNPKSLHYQTAPVLPVCLDRTPAPNASAGTARVLW